MRKYCHFIHLPPMDLTRSPQFSCETVDTSTAVILLHIVAKETGSSERLVGADRRQAKGTNSFMQVFFRVVVLHEMSHATSLLTRKVVHLDSAGKSFCCQSELLLTQLLESYRLSL